MENYGKQGKNENKSNKYNYNLDRPMLSVGEHSEMHIRYIFGILSNLLRKKSPKLKYVVLDFY